MRTRGIAKIYLYPTIFIVAVVGLAVLRIVAARWGAEREQPPATHPVTQPASQPATEPVVETQPAERPLVDLLDVILADDPDYPTTQPLDLPADLEDAAKVVIKRPVHLDDLGRLWITHPQGRDIEQVLRRPIRERTLVVKQTVLHVLYPLNGGKPSVFVASDGPTVLRTSDRETNHLRDIPTGMRWNEATCLGSATVVVPHDRGAILYAPDGSARDIDVFAGIDRPDDHNPARLISTGDRVLVWSPFEAGRPGSPNAVLVDEKSTKTLSPGIDWFDQPIQFSILADGSILSIGRTDDGIGLRLTSLEAPPAKSPDEVEKIKTLARKLADRDPRVRETTQRELEALGPSIHPQLEAIRESMPAEAQVRIETLLGQRFAPTLAGLRPLPGKVETVARFGDGGCVLLLTGGGITTEDGVDQTIIPAWIAVRPGFYIERLPDNMVAGFNPGRYKLFATGGEWVAFDPVLGVRRWMGSRYQTLLPKPLRAFDELVGIDMQRRWVFTSSRDRETTLIIDPSLPDSTPRLPVWIIDAPDGAGWTDTGWPAVKREKQAFVLDERNWRLIDGKTEKFIDESPKVLATTASIGESKFELVNNRVTRDGTTIIDDALGASTLHVAAGRLFLAGTGAVHRFDTSGRFEETFTRRLPSEDPKRVWVDPAGRLVIAGETSLHVCFPAGRVPGAIKSLMLQAGDDDEE
jgi:hypothetical protein